MKMEKAQSITLLGATGSIGKSALQIMEQAPDQFRLKVMTVGHNAARASDIITKYEPEYVFVRDEETANTLKKSHPKTEINFGEDKIAEAALITSDITIAAITGIAGLAPTLNAAKRSTRLCIANKESIVCGYHLIKDVAQKSGANIIPIDSEHSAAFNLLRTIKREDLKYLTITASGGALREWPKDKIPNARLEDVLNHPTWNMGAKVTVDSASLMNKALEVIEAAFLFDLSPDQIQVKIHPQSFVHAMITLTDGSIRMEAAAPDMRIPIAQAMYAPKHPKTTPTGWNNAHMEIPNALTFEDVDQERYPLLSLAYDALNKGGSAPLILNAINEVTVDALINQKITYHELSKTIIHSYTQLTESLNIAQNETLEELLDLDSAVKRSTQNAIRIRCDV